MACLGTLPQGGLTLRLASTTFTWPILEYFFPFIKLFIYVNRKVQETELEPCETPA